MLGLEPRISGVGSDCSTNCPKSMTTYIRGVASTAEPRLHFSRSVKRDLARQNWKQEAGQKLSLHYKASKTQASA